jgi:hypothetical protein
MNSLSDGVVIPIRPSLRNDWQYGAATLLVVLLGFFLFWIEDAFARSWFLPPYKSWPARTTGLMALVIVVSSLLYLMRPRFVLLVNSAASGTIAIMVICFLASILDIAQGNNDSGDVFWPVVLPGIVSATYSFRSYKKAKDRSRFPSGMTNKVQG